MARKSNSVFVDKLPEDAKKLVAKKKNLILAETASAKARKRNFSKDKYLLCMGGHDIMQNLIVIRPYIMKKYNIEWRLVELLLYLFPLQFFTQEDYTIVPKPYTYRSVKDLMREDMIRIAVNGDNRGKHLYTLTTKAKSIVVNFYQYVSGEKKVPMNSSNPFIGKDVNAHDKKRLELIKILNSQEVPETKKKLFS